MILHLFPAPNRRFTLVDYCVWTVEAAIGFGGMYSLFYVITHGE